MRQICGITHQRCDRMISYYYYLCFTVTRQEYDYNPTCLSSRARNFHQSITHCGSFRKRSAQVLFSGNVELTIKSNIYTQFCFSAPSALHEAFSAFVWSKLHWHYVGLGDISKCQDKRFAGTMAICWRWKIWFPRIISECCFNELI